MFRKITSIIHYFWWTLLLPEFIKNISIHIFFRIRYRASKNILWTCNVEIYDLLRGAIKLWEYSHIGREVILRWNITIGSYTYVTDNWQLHSSDNSPIFIWNFCSIAPNSFIISYSLHSPDMLSTSTSLGGNISYTDHGWPINIGNDVWIGANVTILPGVTVGNGAIIGAWSIVTKNIPPYAIAVWNPAKVIKYRFDDEIIVKLQNKRWWEKDIETIRKEYKEFLN